MVFQPGLQILFPETEIAATVGRLASEISRDYRKKTPLFIAILKGSFIFLADLIRQLDFPMELDFIIACSYGKGAETSGEVKILHEPRISAKGRRVVVIEDIADTGLTTAAVVEHLKKQKPASLKLCVLLDKRERRLLPVKIDYLGLTVPNKFLVGYGLDCDEKYRNLPDVYVLDEKCQTQ
jgi:hypoxanthine phosphoribosyltransferase